ncbi:MAG TPA: non-homologous end-joining DNA ligase [Mycobacteriales bacterium]|nr:non-homologous end-joining DNA ligase [Mycobacteriales bacterium]
MLEHPAAPGWQARVDREDPARPVPPMLPVAGPLPARGEDFGYEFKWDGVRAGALLRDGSVRLVSRNQRDITDRYPELSVLGGLTRGRQSVLDGEIVALDGSGRPSFEVLQRRMHLRGPDRRLVAATPVWYYVFDLVHLDGWSTRRLSYADRRGLLDDLDLSAPGVRVPPWFAGAGAEVLQVSRQHGLEGVLAKRLDSVYTSGRRSNLWVKVKLTLAQEVVVGGWKPGRGRRRDTLGSLLLGVPGPDGLRYAGHVGTGFSEAVLRDLTARLRRLERDTSPFAGQVPREHARGVRWVRPHLVGEVRFTEWTRDGVLRHPSWRGLRPDKSPGDVTAPLPVPADLCRSAHRAARCATRPVVRRAGDRCECCSDYAERTYAGAPFSVPMVARGGPMPPTIRAGMSVGERVAVWRVYRGMTQEACAGLVGKSLSWWKKIESGVRRVEKFSDLVLIAQVLKVPDMADLTGVLEYSLALDRARGHPVVPAIRSALLAASNPLPVTGDPPSARNISARLAQAHTTFHQDRMFVERVGTGMADLLTDATVGYRRADRADGPDSRRVYAGLLSGCYLLTTRVLRHASAYDLAWTAVDRATHYAYEADDPVRVAWAFWQSSGVLKDLGRPEEGLDQCRQALALLAPLMAEPTGEQVSLYGETNLQTALMAGHCSDEGTAMRYWDIGEASYQRVPAGYRNPVTEYGRDGGMWAAVWVNVALGKCRAAVNAADRIDIGTIPSRPLQALWRVNVARGYAARRQDVATLHVLRQAEEASPETVAYSVHVREICREMLRRDRKPISRELHDFVQRIGLLS